MTKIEDYQTSQALIYYTMESPMQEKGSQLNLIDNRIMI